jgi:hypothetical protein
MTLWQHGVFCRRTIRSNHKFVPKSILFTPTEAHTLVRGAHCIAVFHERQILAVDWLDNRSINCISTADTSDIVNVKRRWGLSNSMSVANYNKYMGLLIAMIAYIPCFLHTSNINLRSAKQNICYSSLIFG